MLHNFELEINSGAADSGMQSFLPLICNVKTAIKEAVIANAVGFNMQSAHGHSICFPYNHTDNSYADILVSKRAEWLQFQGLFLKYAASL